ncbi:unnamed protein product, partial [marine sediment metagenome]
VAQEILHLTAEFAEILNILGSDFYIVNFA